MYSSDIGETFTTILYFKLDSLWIKGRLVKANMNETALEQSASIVFDHM